MVPMKESEYQMFQAHRFTAAQRQQQAQAVQQIGQSGPMGPTGAFRRPPQPSGPNPSRGRGYYGPGRGSGRG